MASITVKESDIVSAATFLENYISDRYPDLAVSRGTVLRDVLIDGMASIVAFLRAEISRLQSLQSLREIANLPDDADRDDALDALLSNFFITRKTGVKSRGLATLHLSTSADVVVPTTATFIRGGLTFVPDYSSDTLIPATDLVPIIDASGQVTEYTVDINLISDQVGAEYDISPGIFDTFTQVSPYLTSVTNDNSFSGGKSIETTDDLLTRASTAITLRGMITDKSIRTTLMDTFSSVNDVVVVGFGDPEMHRDSLPYGEFHSGLHRGGFVDVYIDTPIAENKMYETVQGSPVTVPYLSPIVLKDSSVPDFTTLGLEEGDVVRIYNPNTGDPDTHFIAVNAAVGLGTDYVLVNPRVPFPSLRTGVEYSVGSTGPSYDDKISRRSTGEFSSTLSGKNAAVLPAEPILRIKSVTIYDPSNTFGLVDPEDNRIHFTQVNEFSSAYGLPGYTPQYMVFVFDPTTYGSDKQVVAIITDPAFEGQTVRVIYDTVSDFDTVSALVSSDSERSLTANTLVKAFHPVYISFDLKYKLKATADATSIDEESIKSALVSYINGLPLSERLNVSDIINFVMQQDTNIGTVVPNSTVSGTPTDYAVLFTLYSPDGRRINYASTDAIVVSESNLVDSNAIDRITDEEALAFGISERTIKYLTTTSDITFTAMS